MFGYPKKYHNFSRFAVGERVLISDSRRSESVGTIIAIGSVMGSLYIEVQLELGFDPCNKRAGLRHRTTKTKVGEHYRYPVKKIDNSYGQL